MDRRQFFFLTFGLAAHAADAPKSVRGKLKDGAINGVKLTGDDATLGVLTDPRLDGMDFEVLGHFTDPTHFDVDKIHTRSMFVHQAGKRLMVSYWCDVCYIRTYTPGKCWCCQKDTDLDLREALD